MHTKEPSRYVLIITAHPRGEGSHTYTSADIVERHLQDRGARTRRIEAFHLPIKGGPGSSGDSLLSFQKEMEEVKSADEVVICCPMWNFSFPWALKNYMDGIMVAGETFHYKENGFPEHLLSDLKKVSVITTSGTPPYLLSLLGMDYLTPLLRREWRLIGAKNFHSYRNGGSHIRAGAKHAKFTTWLDTVAQKVAEPSYSRF